MCKMWGFSRGFSIDWPRHKIGSKDYKKVQGPNRKTSLSSSTFGLGRTEARGVQKQK
jgi:hypothetical protein